MEGVSVTPDPVRSTGSLRTMIGILIGLAIVAVVVWINRPVAENYQPPPVKAKTVAQVEREIAETKANKTMTESQKARILGYLANDMETAKKFGGK